MLFKCLDFLNVLDSEGRLSITNIGLMALIAKMVIAASVDWPSVVAVIAAFSNYSHKRSVIASAQESDEKVG